jgi:hypothetical protein
VSSVGIQSAVVSTDIDAKNIATGLFVQWGTTSNYGSATGVASVNYDYSVRRDITISNLTGGTLYHVRVVATNSVGTNYGNELTLTTGSPASVTTLPAFPGATSAVLNASASLSGAQTSAYFQWGATTNYGQLTSLQDLGWANSVINFSASVTGLLPEATYHYRAVVFAGGVTNIGNDVAFTTTPPPTNTVVTNLLTQDVLGAIQRGGTVKFQTDGTLVLSNQLGISSDVCLDATGHSVVLSGGNSNRIFSVGPGVALCLTNLTLANGRSANGAAIYNDHGTVRGQQCVFLNNTALGTNGLGGTNGPGGGSSCDTNLVTAGSPGGAATPGESVAGGAIFNLGMLSLNACSFFNNQAIAGSGGKVGDGGSGGIWSCGPQPHGAREGGAGGASGSAGTAHGGSIANFGTLLLNRCIFSNSIAAGGVGGGVGLGGPANFGIGSIPGYPNTTGVKSPASPGGAVQGGVGSGPGSQRHWADHLEAMGYQRQRRLPQLPRTAIP